MAYTDRKMRSSKPRARRGPLSMAKSHLVSDTIDQIESLNLSFTDVENVVNGGETDTEIPPHIKEFLKHRITVVDVLDNSVVRIPTEGYTEWLTVVPAEDGLGDRIFFTNVKGLLDVLHR